MRRGAGSKKGLSAEEKVKDMWKVYSRRSKMELHELAGIPLHQNAENLGRRHLNFLYIYIYN